MENIDKLVQLITDRLLENLQHQPNETSVFLIGKESTREYLASHGCRVTQEHTSADFVVVDDLALDAFLRVASLCPADAKESSLLTSLLEGKKVLISLEAFNIEQYKQSAKSLLYRELLAQKAKLEKYGATFYSETQLLSLLEAKEATKDVVATHQSTPVSQSSKSKLITESKLRAMQLSEGDTFTLEKGMIVTALAKDYLKRHKIRIVN
ncbi:hypothetical protein [Streptococcus merionis]|uniref:Ethanolamine utilization cobalamin adenosyltransferase n=1 Tax=Streptococcus merionis TaxID=400065 RepID=A0A239SMV6_9STRE|nr:hypothetical protein [Streptococcus merionis]SNU86716.1 Ethanolamine utilization cobalamin adenosyltransferase [Streptococcus merionis]